MVARLLIVLALGLASPVLAAQAGTKSLYTTGGSLFDSNRYALKGYDAVAYFEQGRAVKGSKAHQTRYRDAVWRFASRKNLEMFRAEPERYVPQYGGHCAWTAAAGSAAPGDPEHWEIVEGKLYLNYSEAIHRRWQLNRTQLIEQADAHWAADGLN